MITSIGTGFLSRIFSSQLKVIKNKLSKWKKIGWKKALLACLHDQNKRGFFGVPDFIQPIRAI